MFKQLVPFFNLHFFSRPSAGASGGGTPSRSLYRSVLDKKTDTTLQDVSNTFNSRLVERERERERERESLPVLINATENRHDDRNNYDEYRSQQRGSFLHV